MNILKYSVAAMLAVAVALIIGSVVGLDGVYKSSIFFALVILLLAVLAVGVVKYRAKISLHKVGFYIVHIAVFLIVGGALLGALTAKSVYVTIPVGEHTTYREFITDKGGKTETLNLGYSIAITGFKTENYENTDDVKQYEATLRIYDGNTTKDRKISINNPATYKGWKTYLMSYDNSTMSTVTLYLKKDPGNLLLLIGFIAVNIGTAIMCFTAVKRKRIAEGGEDK